MSLQKCLVFFEWFYFCLQEDNNCFNLLQIQIKTVAATTHQANLSDKVISCRFHQTMKETYASSRRTCHDGGDSYRGRERIQQLLQLRAITLQKKKLPSFSMLELGLSKVRKMYCTVLTFLSKVKAYVCETKRNETKWIIIYWNEHIQRHNSPIPLCDNLNKECRLKSSLHRVVYTKTAKESEEISCISLQSSRRSFCKIQIFKFAYSALPLFYSLFIG